MLHLQLIGGFHAGPGDGESDKQEINKGLWLDGEIHYSQEISHQSRQLHLSHRIPILNSS